MGAQADPTGKPLISVVTATYNLLSQGRGDSFRRVVDCMARQNCPVAEHVIQDGASTDGTVEFIRGLIDGAPRSRLISAPDGGLYDAMNRGVEAARGDYVLFLNSDDALASDGVLNEAAERLASCRPDFLYGATLGHTGDDGNAVRYRMSLKAVLQRMPFCHNSVFLRRDVFLGLGGHDTQFPVAADYDLVLRLISEGYRGERMEHPVSLFWTRGISGDAARTAKDYARVWEKYFAGYRAAQNLTQGDFETYYRRGHMPASLLLEVLRRPDTPRSIKAAARHSFFKTLRRSLQPWRRF
ncbi:glycosyltransferase [Ruegeria sediminis]|uniref:Glycosyltransferase n=1 Tax=Ruegeria sediminis TaxID=2583820 RepID=A0ABY2WZ64_9RHOB|nr:glycosyltransferase family 2 protein [Ruegeria sediminis]TMV07881.1 glycosyltransferase [Ruegeria sediminis]